jgi:hypothetical protein
MPKMTAALRDFTVFEGQAVTATGKMEVGPYGRTRLWVAPAWQREDQLKLSGGDVSISLSDSEYIPSWSRRKITVDGVWHHESIVEARLTLVDSVVPQKMFRADESLPAAHSLDPDEQEAILRELDTHADNLILAVGGSPAAMSVQLLYVTSEFAQWHSTLKAVRLDVIPSIRPT